MNTTLTLHQVRGTNQYKVKHAAVRTRLHREPVKRQPSRIFGLKTSTWRDLNILAAALLPVLIFGNQSAMKDVDLARHLVSPISMTAYAQEAPQWKLPELASPETRTEVQALIRKIWGRDASVGLAIARCESGYRPTAINHNTNHTDDQGVFQVNTVHGMPDMFNPTANISYAYTIYEKQGTAPWDSSAHCWKEML